ncbi:uncharacterized protein BDR25DRAFT_101770 [Lindgomyces ingoldianus]|uniref:Uncharacterized protein n=1 Tax=Lindgomyces ingoldianus TaxID=673940 RepID=A0ACB6RAG0_9PLEO|nr:uncharacterized protein BDR25DRAFT_101770 [Lindgomyces ingoldianus]KAF2475325.1 hypothetical protein BDR25DRAFT_101770 [Lindgomyces ingoldianus]
MLDWPCLRDLVLEVQGLVAALGTIKHRHVRSTRVATKMNCIELREMMASRPRRAVASDLMHCPSADVKQTLTPLGSRALMATHVLARRRIPVARRIDWSVECLSQSCLKWTLLLSLCSSAQTGRHRNA